MEFSENVTAIFDEIAARFGIIIDWSEDNILPYLEILFNRWRTYEIIVNSIPVLLFICCTIILLILDFLNRKEEKEIKEKLSTLEEYEDYHYKFHNVSTFSKHTMPTIEFRHRFIYTLVCIGIIDFICFTSCLVCFPHLLKAIFIPEILFYEQFLG